MLPIAILSKLLWPMLLCNNYRNLPVAVLTKFLQLMLKHNSYHNLPMPMAVLTKFL
jgi:hypothetical protein